MLLTENNDYVATISDTIWETVFRNSIHLWMCLGPFLHQDTEQKIWTIYLHLMSLLFYNMIFMYAILLLLLIRFHHYIRKVNLECTLFMQSFLYFDVIYLNRKKLQAINSLDNWCNCRHQVTFMTQKHDYYMIMHEIMSYNDNIARRSYQTSIIMN